MTPVVLNESRCRECGRFFRADPTAPDRPICQDCVIEAAVVRELLPEIAAERHAALRECGA